VSARRPLVVLRPDAGHGSGRGHVARCVALASAIRRRGGRTLTLLPHRERAPRVAGAVRRYDARESSARVAARLTALRPAAWVVDSYRWTSRDLRPLRRVAPVWVSLDLAAPAAGADGAFAATPHPRGTAADVAPERRLFGPEYFLLPPRLGRAASAGIGDRVAVSFGDGDPRGLTVPVARRLLDGGWRVLAVVGGGVRDRDRVIAELSALGGRVSSLDGRAGLLPVLRRAGWAVLPASQSMGEALALGLPVVVVETATNQSALRRWARRSAVAVDAGRADAGAPARIALALSKLSRSPRRVVALRRRASRAVDGRGALRVARAVLSSAGGAA
jgi:UDP-2,4-diacetamido-2,4,6-trideoxy-beta-L-altropyranose hydrolase